MIEGYYILDETLSTTQDFKAIKEESLAYLQEFSGNAWTNFNASDPGITILDQICFALTELGYCIDFPIKDILTNRDGNLEFKEQFYRPDEILTTTPVSITDFRKYIIDGIDVVKNALIIPYKYGVSNIGGIYDTYLYVDSKSPSDKTYQDQIGLAARYLFARSRNLGESFTLPNVLEKKQFLLSGSLELESKQDIDKVIRGAQTVINNFVFPSVKQYSYKAMVEAGEGTNEIFSGPKLQNGWIKTEDLGVKKDEIQTTQLVTILDRVEGVRLVNHLSFSNTEEDDRKAQSFNDQLIWVDLITSITEGDLKLSWKGKPIDKKLLDGAIAKLKAGTTTHDPKKTVVKTEPGLPEGKYREISDYYSIQNTFPEIFGVGENSVESGASDHTIGRSRQLKGYLTLFDQVLANEFEQLSSLSHLFSFKNAMTSAPDDLRNYLDNLDEYERMNQEYPVPYLRFSPTYFCRSLYDVPKISAILKNSDAFDYSLELKSEGQQEIDNWKAYQQDPYNSYIHGMMDMMEEDIDAWTRRNDILDHILARHGESPYIIDEIIADSEYALDKLQNQIIFKSLYLQNIGLLSYFRCKAYNFLGAIKISETIPWVSEDIWIKLNEELSKDFVFQSHFIDAVEGLSERDFNNYSGIELKLNLLLGLRAQYRNFVVSNFDSDSPSQEVCQAYWMMQDRKGVILIENSLLLQSAVFQVYVRESDNHDNSWLVGSSSDFSDVQKIRSEIVSDQAHLLDQLKNNEVNHIGEYRLTSQEMNEPDGWFEVVQNSGLEMAARANWGTKLSMSIHDPVLKNLLHFFVPGYVPYFSSSVFKDTFDHIMADTLSPRIDSKLQMLSAEQLEELIPKFAKWHNSLIFNASQDFKNESVVTAVIELINELISIYKASE